MEPPLTLSELARRRVEVRKLSLHRKTEAGSVPRVSAVTLQFADGAQLGLYVNHETDELMWGKPLETGLYDVDAAEIYPVLRAAKGLYLTWAWEMTNHQGYFDAVQIELTTSDLVHSMIIQFKAAASNMELYLVERVHP